MMLQLKFLPSLRGFVQGSVGSKAEAISSHSGDCFVAPTHYSLASLLAMTLQGFAIH
jgi:hypothetical protein